MREDLKENVRSMLAKLTEEIMRKKTYHYETDTQFVKALEDIDERIKEINEALGPPSFGESK